MGAELRIWLLGGFRAAVDGTPVAEGAWRRNKAKALVKLLALARGKRLHREQLMDVLWPDLAPEAAAANLRKAVYFARQALAPEHLALRDEMLRLEAAHLWVDVDAFERAAEAGDLRAAVELYGGDLLPEDRFEDWTGERRDQLHARFARRLLDHARELEAAGDLDGATAALERLAAADPLSEEAVTAVIRAHALAGQRHLALRWYRQFEARLDEELGVEPGAEARRLHEDIAAGRFPVAEPARRRPGRPRPRPRTRRPRSASSSPSSCWTSSPPRARSTRSGPGWSWTGAPGWWRRCWSPGAAPPSGWSAARSWPCSASPRPTRTTPAAPSRPASSSWSARRCRSGPASAPAR